MQEEKKTSVSSDSPASKRMKQSTSGSSFETTGPQLGSDCSNSSEYAIYLYQNELLGDKWEHFDSFEPRPPRYYCFTCDIDCRSDDAMYTHFTNIHVSFGNKTDLESVINVGESTKAYLKPCRERKQRIIFDLGFLIKKLDCASSET